MKRIYDDAELHTTIKRSKLKEILLLLTKKVYFTFNSKTYLQRDGVDMDLLLWPVLVDILMIELEKSIVPQLITYIKCWKRYVDYIICFIKIHYLGYILSVFNGSVNTTEITFE